MTGIFKRCNLKNWNDQKSGSPNIYTVDICHNGEENNTTSAIKLKNLPKRPTVNIEFNNLCYSVPSQSEDGGSKKILCDLQGEFRSGELVAILGPSGAGKSTLLNCLNGLRKKYITGETLVNGNVMDAESFRKISCYIMQDGELLKYVTAKEGMMFSAHLKLGSSVSKREKNDIVEEIMMAMGLKECANTRCMNLSGGQRKRLLVAMELVDNPPVMFLDEPTSGLDSSSSVQCASMLKSLALGGRTIVCTIHQPNARICEMFDNLYVLSPGHCIYQGPVGAMVPFLSSQGLICPSYHNPADFVIEVAMGQHGPVQDRLSKEISRIRMEKHKLECNNIKEIYKTKSQDSDTGERFRTISSELELTPRKGNTLDKHMNDELMNFRTRSSTISQFWTLYKRCFVITLRDLDLTQMRLISHVAVGLLIGYLYMGKGKGAENVTNNAGCLFFCSMFLMFSSMMPTVMTFPLELAVYRREYLNNWYSIGPLYLAKTCIDIPFQMVFSFVYISIVYYMTEQPFEIERFGLFLFVNILMSLVASGQGLIAGTALRVETGTFFAPMLCIPCLLFSGFFLSLDGIPSTLRWLSYASYMRYGFEGSLLSVYSFDRPKLDCSVDYCHFREPSQFLEHIGMQDASYWNDCIVLAAMFIFSRVISYFILLFTIKSSK